jgi:large subunit ribosomal protein L15
MVKLHDLQPAPGATKRRTRKGRGISAGKGKTAGRGQKGQNARAGGGVRPYFEGGQIPLVRRLPQKRGFRNRTRLDYVPVNLGTISAALQCGALEAEGAGQVTPALLAEAGIIRRASAPVAILGDGELDRPLIIHAHRFSKTAQAKIEAVGGSIKVLGLG